FGTDGKVLIDFPIGEYDNVSADTATVLSDGRVVLAGKAVYETYYQNLPPPTPPNLVGDYAGAVVGLTAAGQLDPSFGTGGRVSFSSAPGTDSGAPVFGPFSAVAALPDGRLELAGNIGNSNAAARLLPDGRLDPTYGSGGIGQQDIQFPIGS